MPKRKKAIGLGAAKEYGLNEKQVREWRQNKDTLMSICLKLQNLQDLE